MRRARSRGSAKYFPSRAWVVEAAVGSDQSLIMMDLRNTCGGDSIHQPVAHSRTGGFLWYLYISPFS